MSFEYKLYFQKAGLMLVRTMSIVNVYWQLLTFVQRTRFEIEYQEKFLINTKKLFSKMFSAMPFSIFCVLISIYVLCLQYIFLILQIIILFYVYVSFVIFNSYMKNIHGKSIFNNLNHVLWRHVESLETSCRGWCIKRSGAPTLKCSTGAFTKGCLLAGGEDE